jgi:hypothetical protein
MHQLVEQGKKFCWCVCRCVPHYYSWLVDPDSCPCHVLTGDNIKGAAEDAKRSAGDNLRAAREQASEAADDTRRSLAEGASRAADKISEGAGKATGRVQGTLDKVSQSSARAARLQCCCACVRPAIMLIVPPWLPVCPADQGEVQRGCRAGA